MTISILKPKATVFHIASRSSTHANLYHGDDRICSICTNGPINLFGTTSLPLEVRVRSTRAPGFTRFYLSEAGVGAFASQSSFTRPESGDYPRRTDTTYPEEYLSYTICTVLFGDERPDDWEALIYIKTKEL